VISRRSFMGGASAAYLCSLQRSRAAMSNALALPGKHVFAASQAEALSNGTGSSGTIILDDSWRLWLDEKAPWQDDKLYLPDEVDLAKLPIHPPTDGWEILNHQAGIPVTLPGTVEEHYWDKSPLPTANPSRPEDVVALNSAYLGVSWWYRTFTPPALEPGERLIFSFPGARLRAEVYVNGKLVAYNLITEIPFEADATDVLQSGKLNQLSIRITNPGGTFSWGDFELWKWGSYAFPASHAFGGIDGGVAMSIRGPISVTDLAIANHPDPRTVTLHAEIVSKGRSYKGPLSLAISRDQKQAWSGIVDVGSPADGQIVVSHKVTVPDADLWDIGHPAIYRASASIASIPHSDRITEFGFRWFDAAGIGQNPRLVLNGRRIFVKSAISWGYWAPNGIFPDRSAVQREIDAVHALGLNCIQTHRHFPKAAVIKGFNHAGLLRYCEPGGGSAIWDESLQDQSYPAGRIDTSGVGGEPVTFANRYELAKLLAMVRAYRSHPSIILWSLNNETGANLHNPKIFYAMRKLHELDPSRIVVLKSGFGPDGEVMGMPYSTELAFGDDATHNDSGWHDMHNEDDSGVYQDSLYIGPANYKCYSTDAKGIAMWGELGTGNSSDNDAAAVRWYKNNKVPGYTYAAAEARLAAYEAFLDKYEFRSAFPTAEALFQGIGAKHYFAAAHIVENARISDANDYIALTGWESTTIDNNSGLVDSLRHLKGDPTSMQQANAHELLVVRARHYVVAKGDAAIVDIHIVNEVNHHGSFYLHFSVAMDAAKDEPFFKTSFSVDLIGGDIFAELLKDNISFTPPMDGPATMTASLMTPDSTTILYRTEPLLIVDPNPNLLKGTIACVDYDGKLIPALHRQLGITAVQLTSAPTMVDSILISSGGTPRFTWPARKPAEIHETGNTDDYGLYAQQYVGQVGEVFKYDNPALGSLKVEIFFAEPYVDRAGQRIFDVALNGQTVLKSFDIVAEAGGRQKALVKEFTVSSPGSVLSLSVPRAEQAEPIFAAIRITDAKGGVSRQVFRNDSYRDRAGNEWRSVLASGALVGFDWASFLPTVLDQVRNGSRLILLGMNAQDIGEAAGVLAQAKILTYSGTTGFDDTPWIGHWYFSRKHWLLDGLPSDCVLDWQYQAAGGGDGLILDAHGMEPVIGYGMNPGPSLGFGSVVIPVGRGKIILLAIPGLNQAFIEEDPRGFQPVTARRIVYNALHTR